MDWKKARVHIVRLIKTFRNCSLLWGHTGLLATYSDCTGDGSTQSSIIFSLDQRGNPSRNKIRLLSRQDFKLEYEKKSHQ